MFSARWPASCRRPCPPYFWLVPQAGHTLFLAEGSTSIPQVVLPICTTIARNSKAAHPGHIPTFACRIAQFRPPGKAHLKLKVFRRLLPSVTLRSPWLLLPDSLYRPSICAPIGIITSQPPSSTHIETAETFVRPPFKARPRTH